jgi:hypothetical protein
MGPLPSDVRDAFGVSDSDTDWVRVRASPGSVIGETFLLRRAGAVRAAARSSALADLLELELDVPPRWEEGDFDASVVLVAKGTESRVAVGFLDRDEVRAFFTPRAAEPSDEASAPTAELTEARERLLRVLDAHLRQRTKPSIELSRARLVELLRERVRSRKAELAAARAEMAERDRPDVAQRRADRAIAQAASLERLDKRVNVLEDALRGLPPGEHLDRVKDALGGARKALRKKRGVLEEKRKGSTPGAGSSWLWTILWIVVGLGATFALIRAC